MLNISEGELTVMYTIINLNVTSFNPRRLILEIL